MSMQWNNYQTPLEELHLDEEPQEIQDQFFDFINNCLIKAGLKGQVLRNYQVRFGRNKRLRRR